MSKELWNQYEEIGVEDLTSSRQRQLLQQMIKELSKDDSRVDELNWELDAVDFCFVLFRHIQVLDNVDRTYIKKCTDAFKQRLDEDKAINYFETRLNSTANPYIITRLGYCLWELKRDPEFLQITVEALLRVTDVCVESNNLLQCSRAVQTAYSISTLNNYTKLIDKVAKHSLNLIQRLYDKSEFRWILELTEINTHYWKNNKPDDPVINDLILKLKKIAGHYLTDKKYHLQRSFLKMIIPLVGFLSQDSEKTASMQKEIRKDVAKSHEIEAEERLSQGDDEALPAIVFYEDAIKEYHVVGMPEKEQELMHKIAEASKKIRWKKIETKIVLPSLTFDGKTPTEIYSQISSYDELIPPVDFGKDIGSGLAELLPRYAISDPYPISGNKKADSSYTIKRNKMLYFKVTEARFASAFQKLEEDKRISSDSLVDFLRNVGMFSMDTFPLLEKGIDKHFEGDYVASIHILIPQVEAALRSILLLKRIPIEKEEMGAIIVKEMGGILNEDTVKKILGENLANYLSLKFTDRDGTNTRNEVAHGLLKAIKFDHMLSASVLYVLLKLSKMYSDLRKQDK